MSSSGDRDRVEALKQADPDDLLVLDAYTSEMVLGRHLEAVLSAHPFAEPVDGPTVPVAYPNRVTDIGLVGKPAAWQRRLLLDPRRTGPYSVLAWPRMRSSSGWCCGSISRCGRDRGRPRPCS